MVFLVKGNIDIAAAGAVDWELLYIELGNLLPLTATTAAKATATTTQTPHSRAHPRDYGQSPFNFPLPYSEYTLTSPPLTSLRNAPEG